MTRNEIINAVVAGNYMVPEEELMSAINAIFASGKRTLLLECLTAAYNRGCIATADQFVSKAAAVKGISSINIELTKTEVTNVNNV